MAYLILSSKGRETARRRLDGPVTIGRAPDCELAVRDILLSRRHCRIEPAGSGWVVVDLRSKNGTWLDGQPVGRRGLRYGESVRAGKTTIQLMAGNVPADEAGGSKAGEFKAGASLKSRPADPFEAMAGTMAGTVVDLYPSDDSSTRPFRPTRRFPTPRPMPPEPAAYARDDVYSMLTEIASSSWDSIYANASRPTRPSARVVTPARAPGTGAGAGIALAGPPPATKRRPKAPVGIAQPDRADRTPTATATATAKMSRSKVDWSLQVQAARPARPVRPAFPLPMPVEDRLAAGVLLRCCGAVARGLARVRRWVAPQASVMLF